METYFDGRKFIYIDSDGREINEDYFKILRKSFPDNSKTVYSDRLRSWDSEKFDKFSVDVFGKSGDYFYGRSDRDIEKFLSLYLNIPVEILCVECIENVSTGYPYWRFDYIEKGE